MITLPLLLLTCAISPPGTHPEQSHLDALPPTIPWNGKSRELVVPADDPWITPFERSGLIDSPSYDETVGWLEKLVAAAPELEMVSLGQSGEGREVWMVIASADGAFTPEEMRATNRPVFLAQAGIHAGEIDGKDAGMMLLRDMTVRGTKRELLEGANLLFIPILSVDGHERCSPYGRINQRGPREMGWRTNARNLNLNRDYTKLDTPEVRGVIGVINEWDPDLYFDIHVTDGMDYQYDITMDCVGPHGYSPEIAGWLESALFPRLFEDLEAWGHIPGPMIFSVDPLDWRQGVVKWTGSPRFSNSYGDARHLPTVLIENHSLKPYDQRVLGTYVLLESTMRALAGSVEELRRVIRLDRERRPAEIPVSWRASRKPPGTIEFLGIESRVVESPISGSSFVEWLGKPITATIPYIRIDEPEGQVSVPKAYWIPPAWREVIERLEGHGIEFERLEEGRDIEVEVLRLEDPVLGGAPYEGRVTVTCTTVPERRTEHFPVGSVRVATDQPLGRLAVLLLEPDSPDSLFQWGFFHGVLQRTEYFEAYIMEPMAARMLARDPALQAEFEAALAADEELAGSPRRRLAWFYERTKYFDERWRQYPVAREL
jgi:hypothetical protein